MTVVAFGNYQDPRPLASAQCIRRAAPSATFVLEMAEFRRALAVEKPRCVVLDGALSVRDVSRVLRESVCARDVPLLVVVERITSSLLSSLHAEGADDVVTYADVKGLESRVAALNGRPAQERKPAFKGECVLAHPGVTKLSEFTRVLQQAGFDVLPANNEADVIRLAQERSPRAVVISSGLPPEGGRMALRRLAENVERDLPAVLLAAGNPGAFSPQGWAMVAEDAPPANLLFVLNDLLRPNEQVDGRESRRLLYSTQCNFRIAGEVESTAGLTYNIGRGGLFVRTLASPPRGVLMWLELVPPGANPVVH
ncbi:MAG TPA: hypothetical protein VI299_00255, partial [Polyangiales bacterium]